MRFSPVTKQLLLATGFVCTMGLGRPAAAVTLKTPDSPYEFGLQATIISQGHRHFRSGYQGANSFLPGSDTRTSETTTLFLGARTGGRLELYIDPEIALGEGLSNALGIAGFTNGEVVRNPTLSHSPYLARAFVRYSLPLTRETIDVAEAENQAAGKVHATRLSLSVGKMAVPDFFDINSYANSPRTEFMNWALINNGAYDYAADTRGYTIGTVLEWIHPTWTLRAGAFEMPTAANGPTLASHLDNNRGDNIEIELHRKLLRRRETTIKLLAFVNRAHMGSYSRSLELARRAHSVPDILATEQAGATKEGLGLNVEQPLTDDLGVFGRLGWNDGATESYAYTEIDRTLTLGAQLGGRKWRRPDDRVASSLVVSGLSPSHRDYLAAGGLGFILGDGKLNYGSETIIETYYSAQINKTVSLALDHQFISSPGFNRDRGPVNVFSARIHLEIGD